MSPLSVALTVLLYFAAMFAVSWISSCGAVIFNLSSADRTKTDDVVKIVL